MEKCGSPVAQYNQEILLGTNVGTLVAQWATVFSGLKIERYNNTTRYQTWATKLRTVVAQWTTRSENDLSIPAEWRDGVGLCLESEPIGQPTGASVQSPQGLSYEEGCVGGGELVSTETLYHRDDALLYIAYVMLIWAAPIPADRWHCSLWL